MSSDLVSVTPNSTTPTLESTKFSRKLLSQLLDLSAVLHQSIPQNCQMQKKHSFPRISANSRNSSIPTSTRFPTSRKANTPTPLATTPSKNLLQPAAAKEETLISGISMPTSLLTSPTPAHASDKRWCNSTSSTTTSLIKTRNSFPSSSQSRCYEDLRR